jgi:glycosyltransferase involved in cell wall biosynthesis
MKIVVLICSLGKNTNLSSLISSVNRLSLPGSVSMRIQLVINSQKVLLEDYEGCDIVYEENLGYAHVRNAALRCIKDNESAIFLDDDENINQEWLDSILVLSKDFPNTILTGPVISEGSTLNSYRSLSNQKTGSRRNAQVVLTAATNNLFIPSSILKSPLVYFDPFFNRGGEDSDFIMRLNRHGILTRWFLDLKIHEFEVEERFDVQYLENRKRKEIISYSLILRRNHNIIRNAFRIAAHSVKLIASLATLNFYTAGTFRGSIQASFTGRNYFIPEDTQK